MAAGGALQDWSIAELEAELQRLETPTPQGAVAWRNVAALLHALDADVGPVRVDALLTAGGVDAAAARVRRDRWLPWRSYEALFDALEPLVSEGAARRAGAGAFDSKWLRFLPLGARTLPSVDTIIRWVFAVATGPGGLLFRGCDHEVTRRAAHTLEIRFAPPAGGRFPQFWVEAAAEAIGRLAELTGTAHAEVAPSRERDVVVFHLRHDVPRRPRWARLPFEADSMSGAIEEVRDTLRRRNEELRERIRQLEASERERAALEVELEQRLSSEAVGRFAGAIAHDFNNLLTVIFAELDLAEASLTGETLDDLAAMREAAERAAALSKQLLAVGRQAQLIVRALVLDEAIEGWCELIASAAGEPVEVQFALGAGGARVEADPAQLEGALVELALNASEAMPDGGALTIATSIVEAEVDAGGRWVSLTVADTGSGMSADVRAQALEPYFSTRSRHDASGLGLATVHGIVRQLGGALGVHSTPGEGTTIEIRLPIIEESS